MSSAVSPPDYKKPARSRAFSSYSEHQLEQLIKAIKQLEQLFQQHFSLDIYLTWGTLLGAVREGNFIQHDTDIDLAYFSRAETDFEIVEEHEWIVRTLLNLGYPVSRNSKGQIHVNMIACLNEADREQGLAAFNLDLWTTFCLDGRYYHYPDIQGELEESSVIPLERMEFQGENFWKPAKHADVLAQFYGENWQTPDSGYAWYPRYSSTDVFEFLRNRSHGGSVPDKPKRCDDLDITEKDGFYYVHASHIPEPQRLNASAILILELCTGEQHTKDIILLLQETFELPSAPEVVVLEFLSYALSIGIIE